MNIKFKQYQLIPNRDETRVEDTFRDAVADCIGPGRRTTLMPERLNYYESGEVSLAVQPEEGSESAIAGCAPLLPSLIEIATKKYSFAHVYFLCFHPCCCGRAGPRLQNR